MTPLRVISQRASGVRVYPVISEEDGRAIDLGEKHPDDCIPYGILVVADPGVATWGWRGTRCDELSQEDRVWAAARAVELEAIHDRADRDAAIDAKDGRI